MAAVGRQRLFRKGVKNSPTNCTLCRFSYIVACLTFSVCACLTFSATGKGDEVSLNTAKQLLPKYLEISMKGYE